MNRAALAIIALLCVAGCRTVEIDAHYSVPEHSPYEQPGTGVVTGQAFAPTRGAIDIITGAGSEVYLLPATSYGERFIELAYRQRKATEIKNLDYLGLVRATTADKDSEFRFEGVPAGDYYAACTIGQDLGARPKTIYLLRRVSVTDGEEARVILKQAPRHWQQRAEWSDKTKAIVIGVWGGGLALALAVALL